MFVVAFAFKVLLKRGIPPKSTKLRDCKINAIIVNAKSNFSLIRFVSLVSLIFILYLTIHAPIAKTIHANIIVKITSKSNGSSKR